MLSNTVRSGGKTRRAANMGIFKFDHPDVLEILDSKLNGDIQTFNLSMSVTDKFMSRKYKKGQVHLSSPSIGELAETINRDDIWKRAIKNAWTNGDPGLFFFDTVNKFNPFPSRGDIDCTNPCGEVPLPPWSICNIGSINVSHFVKIHPSSQSQPIFYFDWDEFKKIIPQCFTFLDRVIEKQEYIHPRFMKNAKDWRPVGLGIMGFADALIKLNIAYDSQEAIILFEEICFQLNYHCIKTSIEMAKDPDEWVIQIPCEDSEHFRNLIKYYTKNNEQILEDFDDVGIHNSNWTMIAPTGSISLSADCSYGWEPLMALVWEKPLVESDQVLKIIHPQFEEDLNELCKNQGIDPKVIIKQVIENKGSIQDLNFFPAPMKAIYKVAHDIDPIFKVSMQGAGQKWISMAISSTTNLPNYATQNDVENIFKVAWKNGLKGITVFRNGCRSDQIVHFGKQKIDPLWDHDKEKTLKKPPKIIEERPIKRDGSTVEINSPHGKFYVTVNFVNDKPIEMFFSVGKQGGLVNVVIDALARICSKGLQAGMNMEWIVDTLEGLKGDQPFWFKIADNQEKSTQAQSIVDALSKVLFYHFMPDEDRVILEYNPDNEEIYADNRDCESFINFERCPECHKKGLTHRTGCRGGECIFCGFTNCS
jgi:ribonucleoside-diphosphate reductase alpha chain